MYNVYYIVILNNLQRTLRIVRTHTEKTQKFYCAQSLPFQRFLVLLWHFMQVSIYIRSHSREAEILNALPTKINAKYYVVGSIVNNTFFRPHIRLFFTKYCDACTALSLSLLFCVVSRTFCWREDNCANVVENKKGNQWKSDFQREIRLYKQASKQKKNSPSG